ncbi:Serine/threonine-protein phosphatase [Fasciola hepatica]|uniref:Serine/threonine-protein phosphatase n=1 Tax=Fasciola hepatica TaxID=6192 RepID=A0A2H1CFW7_FASHE|nr:Serine/threonine-protein phosphatase [Fasciola hepatica]
MANAAKPTYEIDLDKVISDLKSNISTPGVRVNLSELECIALCCLVKPIFESETMLLRIQAPVKVCGDIHGQFYDLLRLFDVCEYPPNSRFLFLGDYVDRGQQSVETVCLLFALKIKYPRGFFMLRGNHESEIVNRVYGFREELKERFGKSKVHKHFVSVFNVMPVAAVIENSIFCCHGGLSPDLIPEVHKPLDTLINQIQRPTEVPRQGLLCDLLWSDPADYTQAGDLPLGWNQSTRGCSFTFGVDVINRFLDTYELDLVVRAHQVVEDGYEFYYENRLITLFSAPNYCNQFQNSGGVFVVRKADEVFGTLEGGFEVIRPDTRYTFNYYTRKHHLENNQ